MYVCKFDKRAIEILTEELDRRIEDWIDVLTQQYGETMPDNDPDYDAMNERIHLLLLLEANLDTVELINEFALTDN